MVGLPIVRLSLLAVIITVLCYHTSEAVNKPEINCAAGKGKDKNAKLSCFTCMGRDMENCDWGTVCCTGSCFKLVDEEHDIIAKGCTNNKTEDGSMAVRSTKVNLYWTKDEVLQGQMYYCSKGDYCNGGSSMIGNAIVLLVALGVLKALV